MTTPIAAVLQAVYDKTGLAPRGRGSQWSARCPAHEDRNPSLSIGVSPEGVVKVMCHGGGKCPTEDVMAALELPMSALWPAELQKKPEQKHVDTWMPCGHTKVAEYLYRDEQGMVLYGVARCSRKGDGCQGFRQWRPDPASRSGRRWSLTLDDGSKVRSVPYQLPEVLAAVRDERVVIITEGEKDADNLRALPGVTATTNQGGAGMGWPDDFARYFGGADVSIIADRDETGRKHAQAIVQNLLPVARSIYVHQARSGKDVSDHLAAGGTLGDLIEVWAPKPFVIAGISA